MDISKYQWDYLPLPKPRLTIEELIEFFAENGHSAKENINNYRTFSVTVDGMFRVSTKGYVKPVGRDKNNQKEWERERSKRKKRKGLHVEIELLEKFQDVMDYMPFATWVRTKMIEEICGCWHPKSDMPQSDVLVDGMVLIAVGDKISLCHVSDFSDTQFDKWAAIPKLT